ncbi:uncharacterized protein H6S33_009653 [Morchella sextelata]|uniref:uncharacterized protein n=1 Tax=Morchella sextelata TaxID=1174677 RepID=UPI001D036FDD|nr:uncharacterized protein H6S33_009653 [Morchella sextelata]KAH0613273.1 hypothetical protein H6S33_009653 [Morchella sextelata]
MATTATAPTAANGPASAGASSAASASAARPQLKSTISGTSNGGNTNRRSVQSPIDAQRRNASRGPWQANTHQKYNGGSTNAVTSSSPTPSQAAAMKARNPTIPPGGESDTHDKHMHDRTLFLLANLIGKTITITLKTGARYTGILVGADAKNHDIGVVMKWVKLVRAPLGDSGDGVEEGDHVGGGPEKTMIFEPRDLVDIFAEKIALGEAEGHANHQNGTFRTDADISGNLTMRERELHRWQPDEATNNLSLEESAPGSQAGSQGQGWNQFEVNERLFGLKSDFNEDIYTTKLDRAHPLYQQREAAAARIAREIEGQTINASMNPHVAEERNIALGDDSGIDEEDRYGAVQRNPVAGGVAQAQATQAINSRYTPPALRAPTGHPTVPGAPHDPAIISSQLVRPETLQQKQQQAPQAPRAVLPTINLPQATKSEDATNKPKEKSTLPEIIAPKRMLGTSEVSSTSQPPIPELTQDFKQFVNNEKERYMRRKADLQQKDRASKLEELKKFSVNFTLRTEIPQDLVPILAKDKQKQAEIVEKAKANVAKVVSPTTSTTSQTAKLPGTREPVPNSFAAKNPTEHELVKQQLLNGFPPQRQPQRAQHPAPLLSARLKQIQDAKKGGQQLPHVRSPVPIPEHPQNIPTGPAAGNIPIAPKSISPASMSMRAGAKAMEFRPNPSAATFTPTFGPSTTATPSPTTSAPAHASPRATSPSLFFGNKKPKPEQERKSIKSSFNPIKRMMKAGQNNGPVQTDPKYLKGNSNDFIDMPFHTIPTWPTAEGNEEKKYVQMFARTELSASSTMHSPQPPHIAPHQPHHHPQGPPHMAHANQPPHVSHQPHHSHMPQHHLAIPPQHYEQDQHLRQIPPSVMPSPNLHNATLAPYQQSPVAHHSQMPMYTAHPQGQYVPGGPGAPFVGQFYGGFRGPAGAGQMMVPGPQPIPYPGQFIPHQMYSPQQPHAYMHNGTAPPPPPSSQGYPSPGRGAPMMMHQGSSQGTPAGPQMIPYAMQPGQGGPIYGQGQQQMGMMRGQPLPHQGGPPPPQPYYHGPQGHYPPGGRGNNYGGHPQQQHQGGQHAPPPQPQQPQQTQPQQTAADGEGGK